MKSLNKIILFIGVFLFTLITVRGEIEPNNDPASANTISINTTKTASLALNDEYDWWKVTTPKDGKLIFTETSDATLDVDFELYDVNGTHLIISSNSSGQSEEIKKSNLKAGTYWLRARRFGSGYGNYQLTCTFNEASEPNDPESNDAPSIAIAISENGTATGHLGYYNNNSTDSQDWYKIILPSDGSLEINTATDSTLDSELALFDDNGNHEILHATNSGASERLFKPNLKAGTYYLKVYRYSATYGSYALSIIFDQTTKQNDQETNDEPTSAILFEINSTQTGHLGFYYNSQTDNQDWRKLVLENDGRLEITVLSDSSLDAEIDLYDKNGSHLIKASHESGALETLVVSNLAAGTYFIKTFKYSSSYGSYEITNEVKPLVFSNDSEDNDSVAVAQAINLNEVYTGHLGMYYNSDIDIYDYFKFDITSNIDTLFVKVESNSTLDVDLQILDNNLNSILTSSSSGAIESVFKTNISAGTYYLKLYRYSSTFGQYKFMVSNTKITEILVDVKEPTKLPTKFSLSQNYPNPFNPSTTIKFALPQATKVSLRIYDAVGREVATLVNKEMNAGVHSVKWNASKMASGVYFYRLQAGSFVQTKKLMLLK